MLSFETFDHFKFALEEIVKVTNNFSDENLIGQGGFGKVYKGNLMWSGKPTNIAARRMHYDYGQGDYDFWNQISMLAKFEHDNLVSFIGFCDENGEKIIINKLEVNGSLDKYLSSTTLTWMQRLQICVGVARAMKYIYYNEGHEYSVIHGNIKSSKFLLDEKWNPKLSGFELSKVTTKARRNRIVLANRSGTLGYMDPTFEKTGFLTHKSDVYSLGVVLFEVLCGRRAFVPDERQLHSPQYFTLESQEPSTVGVRSLDDSGPSSFVDGRPSSFLDDNPLSFGGLQPSSFVGGRPSSFDGGQPSAFVGRQPSAFVSEQPSSFDGGQPSSFVSTNPDQSKIQRMGSRLSPAIRFELQPLFTMKRIDQYLHSPNEELLAKLAISHYDEGNLVDIINPALWKQMHPESLEIFSETAYCCLKEKQARPNIVQILKNLEKALDLQMRHENHPAKLKEQHPTTGS